MLTTLRDVESILPSLMNDESQWKSVFADTEKPHLRRLWLQLDKRRVYLHHFTSCESKEEFPHPHPWKMAVRILEGGYVMGVGHSTDLTKVPALTYTTHGPGSCYELLNADQWHAIRPLSDEALTIMVAGPVVYPQNRIRAHTAVRELTPEERAKLFNRIRKHYPSS